jgi:uncharacterized membrane protein
MEWLLAGIALWSIVHLIKAVAPAFHAAMVARLGAGQWRGLVSLLLLASIALMVFGWRQAPFAPLYGPILPARATGILMLLALALFFSAGLPTNLKRFVRHPQLTGTLLWAVAHLAVNGDARSLALFGGLAIWSVAEIVAINRRDGAWLRPDPVGPLSTALPFAIAAVAWLLLVWAHPWIAGVPILPYLG